MSIPPKELWVPRAEGPVFSAYAERQHIEKVPVAQFRYVRADIVGDLITALVTVEWSEGYCPKCKGPSPRHFDGCELSAALRAAGVVR